jgi:hypothetical protein
MQDGATAHTANYSINGINRMLEDRTNELIVACKVSRLKSL